MAVDGQALYVQLGRLIETMPDLLNCARPLPAEVHQWLGRAYALVSASGNTTDANSFRASVTNLNGTVARSQAVQNIFAVLYRALAVAELAAPAPTQGAFIPVGSSFDALSAVSKILRGASTEIFIIDPYMDDRTLTDFVPLAPEAIVLKLLADAHFVKPSLRPAVERWVKQHGTSRPVTAKLASARTLHDRLLLLDGKQVWVLTQSLNAFASRAPASIVRVDAETAELKIAAYEATWASATPLI